MPPNEGDPLESKKNDSSITKPNTFHKYIEKNATYHNGANYHKNGLNLNQKYNEENTKAFPNKACLQRYEPPSKANISK